jgi:uncharacterized repeat protein (TIGR01451 family)
MSGPVSQQRRQPTRPRGQRARLRAVIGTLLMAAAVLQPGFASVVSADPISPVSVVKTASSNPVASGAELTYTIVVTNLGSSKVDNVVMTDQVNGVGVIQNPPALPQLTITSSKGTCTQGGPNGNLVTCNAGTLNGRQVWTVTIRGQVTASSGTTLNNTASVTGTKSAQTFTTTGSVSVLVSGGTGGGDPLPDLTLNKTGPTSVALGAPLTYTLTVNNVGSANTANVRVVDTLPAGVTLAATPFETTSLFACVSSGTPITVVCDGGAVNKGQNATLKINAISPSTTPPTQITNTAVVDPDNTIVESNELNNTSATVNTSLEGPPPEPQLSIKKSDGKPDQTGTWDSTAGPDPVNPGEWLTYIVQVQNNASSRADDVRISDTFQGLEASSLIVSQTVVNGTVGTGRGCVVNAAEAVCSIRSLNAGGTLTMTVKGYVIASAGTNLFNTATVNGNIKNVGVTNTASESTTVRPSIDLTITKSDSPDPICARSWPRDTPAVDETGHLALDPTSPASPASGNPSGTLAEPVCLGGYTYRYVVGNSGNGDASNVVVRDPLPAGVLFDSYDTDGGFACSWDQGTNVVTCSGGAIPAAKTRFIDIRVVAPPTIGQITNEVTVDPNNAIFEPDETNNKDTETTTISTGVDLVIWKGDDATEFDHAQNLDPTDEDPPGDAPALTEGYDPIATNGTQTYTIIVDNIGPQDATGIKVRDVLPAGTKFLSFSATQGFTCTHDGSTYGGNVTCIGGSLPGTAREFYDQVGTNPPGVPTGNKWATIKIKVFATQFVQPILHNEVRVDPDDEIDEIDEANNFAFQDTFVTVGNSDSGAFNQLTVQKLQDSPAGDVATNGILVYDLKVSNLGTDPVSAILVKDTLPSGTRFISARDTDVVTSLSDAFFCSHDGSATGGVITCVGGDLSGSVNKIPDGVGVVPITRTIRVRVYAPNTPATIVNVVGVDPDNQVVEGNEFDNDAALETVVRKCTSLADCTATNAFYELKLTKTQTNPAANPVARNGIVSYELKVENWGTDAVSGVVVTDRLPAGFRFINATDSGGLSDPDAFTCSGPDASGVVTCSGGALDGVVGGIADSRTIQISVFAPDEPGSYTNNSFVDPGNTIPEGNEFNNQSSVQTVVANGGNRPYIDLTVDKTQVPVLDQDTNGPGGIVRVVPGGGIIYDLKVTNSGEDGDAFNVRVRDVLPANVTFFSAEDTLPGPGAFTCGQVPGQPSTIDCVGGTIPQDGGFRTIRVIVVAPTGLDKIASDPGDIKQTLTNSAFVDPDNATPEGDESNNADIVKTQVKSQINLTVVSKEGPSQANQNQEADYVITVKNEKTWGDGRIAFDAVVVDYLPVGLIPLSVSTNESNMACETEENPVNLVTCVGDIEPEQEVKITVHVFITAEDGSLDNEACIDPDHQIDETSELDNCKTKTTVVAPPPAPNLNINKNASTGTVTAGETFTYTVTVSNVGDAAAPTGIEVKDPLPPEVSFVSANATNGFTCAEASGTVTCADPGTGLAAGQASVITIEVTVDAGVTGGFTNKASVNDTGGLEYASVTTNVGGTAVDLILSEITDSPDPANVGQNVSYTFSVTNAGTSGSGAFDITSVMDSMTGLTFVGASASQGFTCGGIAGATVTCSGANLPAGQSTEVKVTFMVSGATPSTHELTVKADSGDAITEGSEANNTNTQLTSTSAALCTSCIDLVIGGILDTPDPVTANGQALKFITSASNAGDIPTTGYGPVDVRFYLPVGTDYVSASANAGFTCVPGNILTPADSTYVDCSGDLLAGQGVVVTVNTKVDTSEIGSAPQVLVSLAYVDEGNVFPEGSGAGKEFTNLNNGYALEFTDFQ